RAVGIGGRQVYTPAVDVVAVLEGERRGAGAELADRGVGAGLVGDLNPGRDRPALVGPDHRGGSSGVAVRGAGERERPARFVEHARSPAGVDANRDIPAGRAVV